MAESIEKPVVDITLDSRLPEEAGYSGDSPTTKPISRKKKTNRKRRHGELTENTSIDTHVLILCYLGVLKELPHN